MKLQQACLDSRGSIWDNTTSFGRRGETTVKIIEVGQQVRVRVDRTVFVGEITRKISPGVYEITISEKLGGEPLQPIKATATVALINPIERIPEPPPNS